MRRYEDQQISAFECVQDFADAYGDLFRKMFDGIFTHGMGRARENTIVVFSDVSIRGGDKIGHMEMEVKRIHPSCLDFPSMSVSSSARIGGDYHLFVAKYHGVEKKLGMYFPKSNVLVTSDLTHAKSGVRILGRILREIDLLYSPKKVKRRPVSVKLMLGADPEFETISHTGRVVCAYELIQDSEHEEQIGLDGASDVAELRPDPQPSPEDAVAEIGRLLRESADMGLYFSHAGNTFAAGYHIHFGGVAFEADTDMRFLRVLDKALYNKMRDLNGSARGGYAGESQYERKHYGFEYRSLPAGIASHPDLLRYTMRVAFELAKRWWENKSIPEDAPAEKYWKLAGLSDEDVKRFDLLIQKYDGQRNLYAAWGINHPIPARTPPPPLEPRSMHDRIAFSEIWSRDNQRDLIDALEHAFEGRELPCLSFFGLAEHRGAVVFGIDVPEITRIFDGALPSGSIGIPLCLRTLPLDSMISMDGATRSVQDWFTKIAEQIARDHE